MPGENSNFALIVHACDRYQLLYKGFEYFFKKFWPEIDGIRLYFLTEEADYQWDRYINIKTGKGEWSDRLRIGLEKLTEPYIIYMQEDMWLNKPVNAETLDGILNYVIRHKPILLKLHSSEVYKTKPSDILISGLRIAEIDNKISNYLMSHQISIWNREFLISQLQHKEHPWRHERKGTQRLKKLDHKLFQVDLFAENGKPPINENVSNDLRSEYQTISVNGMLNDNALPFIEELVVSEVPEIEVYGKKLLGNFKNKVTHDGLPKPRKKGIVNYIFE
jgi:hypothetical protein